MNNGISCFRVIFATNDSGYRFLKLAVHTLVTHVDLTKPYEICILEGEGGVSAANKEDLAKIIDGRLPVKWVNVDPYMDAHREELQRINKGRTLMIWARVFCGEIFGDVDANALYLDTDTYVNGDLTELFGLNLGENLVGMVPEDAKGEVQRGRVFNRECMPEGLKVYCNAGVMLFNPARWRREEAGRRLLDWGLKWNSAFRDQDSVNAIFWDKIRILPTKWNYHDGWVERSLRRSANARAWLGNDPLDVMEAILFPRILHYWGGRKPWKFNHRPERLRYERALRECGLLDGRLEGSTFLKRLALPFWDALHLAIKCIVRIRYRRLQAKRGGVCDD